MILTKFILIHQLSAHNHNLDLIFRINQKVTSTGTTCLIANKELVCGCPVDGDRTEAELRWTRIGFGLLEVRLELGHTTVTFHRCQLFTYGTSRE
jgi:hypothetical protein